MPRGGKRKGSGRKPLDDKKKPINLFVRESKINKIGNIDILKDKIYDFIDSII